MREAHFECQDSGGKGSCERWSAQRVGAKCVGLARMLSPPPPPSSGRTRLSPPSEGHWYIPADSKSLKRAREAKPDRFGPDLCSLRVLCEPRPATLPWGLGGVSLFSLYLGQGFFQLWSSSVWGFCVSSWQLGSLVLGSSACSAPLRSPAVRRARRHLREGWSRPRC